jgi:hypothetical protein
VTIDTTTARTEGAQVIELSELRAARLAAEMTRGKAANGGDHRQISEVKAYERVIAETVSVRRELSPTSDAWRQLGYLLVELEASIAVARAQCG